MENSMKSMKLKKLIGEKVTLLVEAAEGDNRTKIEEVRIIDVGEKGVWAAVLGETPRIYEFWRIEGVIMDLRGE